MSQFISSNKRAIVIAATCPSSGLNFYRKIGQDGAFANGFLWISYALLCQITSRLRLHISYLSKLSQQLNILHKIHPQKPHQNHFQKHLEASSNPLSKAALKYQELFSEEGLGSSEVSMVNSLGMK